MIPRRLLKAVETAGAFLAGGIASAGPTFAAVVAGCEWLKAVQGKDSPAAFTLFLLSGFGVPVVAIVGGWLGYRLIAAPRRPKLLRQP